MVPVNTLELEMLRPGALAEPSRRSWRPVLLALLLPAEILLLTLRFDAAHLAEQAGLSAWLLANASHLLRAVIAAAAATALLGGWRLWHAAQPVLAEERPGRWYLYLVGHAASVCLFAGLTQQLFDSDLLAQAPGLSVAWFALGLATFVLWLAAVLSPSCWPALLRLAAWPLLGGAVAGVAAWGCGVAAQYLWQPLGRATFALVHSIVALFSADVVSDPARLEIGTSTFAVQIAPDCSGYEGIGLILVFLTVYVALFRRHLRFPQVLVLFPAGALLIWLANSVRIAALIGIGAAGAPGVALGGFHSQAGWLTFNVLALGFVAVTTRASVFQVDSTPAASSESRQADATVAYLGPWLALLGTALLLGAFSTGFDWLYPCRIVVAALVLWKCRHVYGRWDGSVSWLAVVLGAVVFVVWLALAPAHLASYNGPPPAWVEAAPLPAALWLVFRLIGYVAVVPLAEELAFRGYLTRRLVQRDFSELALGAMTTTSLLLSALAFGVLHGSCWPAATIAGLLFALALRWRGRLADAVAAHATTNALLSVFVYFTGNWSLWN